MKNPEIKRGASEEIKNELPSQYESWLEFYDDLPADLTNEPLIRTREYISADTYSIRFNQMPAVVDENQKVMLSYLTEHEFMLARLGQELLDSRLSKVEVAEMRSWLTDAGRQAASGDASRAYNEASRRLGPLFEMAFKGAK